MHNKALRFKIQNFLKVKPYLLKAETTIRGVSPSLVSIRTYDLLRSNGMPRSNIGRGRAVERPGMGKSFQNDRFGDANEQNTAPPPPRKGNVDSVKRAQQAYYRV